VAGLTFLTYNLFVLYGRWLMVNGDSLIRAHNLSSYRPCCEVLYTSLP